MPGLPATAFALQRFGEDLSDFTEFWQEYFLPNWYRTSTTHFETQGASSGAQWPPLSAAYADWKQKHWPGLPILVLSGALRDSLTQQNDSNAVADMTPTQLSMGTRVTYARFHQTGTKYMPARPPLRVSREFFMLTAKLMHEFAVKKAKDSGLTK